MYLTISLCLNLANFIKRTECWMYECVWGCECELVRNLRSLGSAHTPDTNDMVLRPPSCPQPPLYLLCYAKPVPNTFKKTGVHCLPWMSRNTHFTKSQKHWLCVAVGGLGCTICSRLRALTIVRGAVVSAAQLQCLPKDRSIIS